MHGTWRRDLHSEIKIMARLHFSSTNLTVLAVWTLYRCLLAGTCSVVARVYRLLTPLLPVAYRGFPMDLGVGGTWSVSPTWLRHWCLLLLQITSYLIDRTSCVERNGVRGMRGKRFGSSSPRYPPVSTPSASSSPILLIYRVVQKTVAK